MPQHLPLSAGADRGCAANPWRCKFGRRGRKTLSHLVQGHACETRSSPRLKLPSAGGAPGQLSDVDRICGAAFLRLAIFQRSLRQDLAATSRCDAPTCRSPIVGRRPLRFSSHHAHKRRPGGFTARFAAPHGPQSPARRFFLQPRFGITVASAGPWHRNGRLCRLCLLYRPRAHSPPLSTAPNDLMSNAKPCATLDGPAAS